MNFKKLIIIFSVLFLYAAHAWGDNFVINKIEVNGLQRISQGTVLSYVPVKKGERLDAAKTEKIITTLHQTGFFSKVDLYQDGNTLIIKVVERPTISSIHIAGNNKIRTKDLNAALKSAGIVQGQVFNKSVLVEIKQALLRQYYNLGRYNVTVAASATPTTRNRVAIDINISEGATAKIRKINIVGNKYFSEEELLRGFSLTRSTVFALFTQSDLYSKEKLNADLEKLRSYYFDRGYLDFKIDSTEVSITPDKRHVYIVIHVTEGSVYKVGSVQLSGNLLGKRAELLKLMTIKKGDVFSRRQVMATVDDMKTLYGDYGYAAANIDPQVKTDKKQHLVALTFVVNPQNRSYIRRISFFGNTKTAEYVLRREMRQMEGGLFSLSSIKESTRRLYNLGYIKDVKPNLKPVPNSTNQMDLDYSVKEDSSATISAQVGLSSGGRTWKDNFIYGGSLNEYNFMGTGKSLGININNSAYTQSYNFSYYDPYFTIHNVGMGVNIYGQQVTPDQDFNMSAYTENTVGGAANYYFPMSEHNRVVLGFGYEHPTIKLYKDSAEEYKDFVADNGDRYNLVKLKAGWNYSNLDRVVFPHSGLTQYIDAQTSLPIVGSTGLGFYKASYNIKWYYPLLNKYFILLTHGYFGFGDGYGNINKLPFFENFYAGGLGTVRGYESSSLGPKDKRGQSTGGNVSLNASAGIIFPNPLGPTVRTTAFMDAGNVYSTHGLPAIPGIKNSSGIRLDLLRYSVGVQVEWRTPFAPLVFSLAEPVYFNHHINKKVDRKEMFQFQIGASI